MNYSCKIVFNQQHQERKKGRNRLRLNRQHTQSSASASYRSYVELLNGDGVSTSTDEIDITESDEESSKDCPPIDCSTTLRDILHTFSRNLDVDQTSRFNINRSDVLDGSRRAIRRKHFHPEYKMSVKFTDDCGASEGALDHGGPKRELLCMILRKVQTLPIFDGPENASLLSLNSTALSGGLYRDVGTLIAMSIVHGGPPPKFFSPVLFDAIVMPSKTSVSIEHVTDPDLREQIQKEFWLKKKFYEVCEASMFHF